MLLLPAPNCTLHLWTPRPRCHHLHNKQPADQTLWNILHFWTYCTFKLLINYNQTPSCTTSDKFQISLAQIFEEVTILPTLCYFSFYLFNEAPFLISNELYSLLQNQFFLFSIIIISYTCSGAWSDKSLCVNGSSLKTPHQAAHGLIIFQRKCLNHSLFLPLL